MVSRTFGHFRFAVLIQCVTVSLPAAQSLAMRDTTDYATYLVEQGFVDVQRVDSTLLVDLKYASDRNFMKANVYGTLNRCYLRKDAAEKLAIAHSLLKREFPYLRLLIADGFRPRRVQRTMWQLVEGTERQRYVANPKWGSMHNYGCAVDLTIADTAGVRLDMGTPIDYFGPQAQPRLERNYLAQGKLTTDQVANRKLLRRIMTTAGFHPIQIEWWHFNAFDKKTVRSRFSIVE